jgi:hypothetical protein
MDIHEEALNHQEPDPNPYETSRFMSLLEEIRAEAGVRLANNRGKLVDAWYEKVPTEWVTQIMLCLRHCAQHINDYREFRKGLIKAAAFCLISLNHGDQLFRAYLGDK